MAKRIQRKRTKGWKMPDGAVYVGRPTKWGNPFFHAQRFCGIDVCLQLSWLRVSIYSGDAATVVLTKSQVGKLRDALTDWLEHSKRER